MKTIGDVFAEFKLELAGVYDANEIEAVTLIVLAEIAGLSKAKIKAFPETELTDNQSKSIAEVLSRLKTGEPVQYILGKTEFYYLPFYVNPSVLIPRPETEELVEWVIESVGSFQLADSERKFTGSILDIGTGSGCIAISLKNNLPGALITGLDISKGALDTAKENAKLNKADVNFIEADILNLKSEIECPKSDIIISNPPYVTLHDKTQMHANVTEFEPHGALFVPENDPLIFYKAITNFAVENLSREGLLFFEINESYGEETMKLLEDAGFINIELRKDMSGRNRMIRAAFTHPEEVKPTSWFKNFFNKS